ncbi:hypothetical protein [Aquimarina macrocephali]|uniref:hypothetical protein n=1 Tax=Aquimarina macrocephali TaxID=666563 RepID=UPI003F67D9B8
MKNLIPTRIALIEYISLLAFATFSCERVNNETLQENKNEELAVFTFSNGNTLQLIESDEEGAPVILAIESGSNKNIEFIDFDSNSILDIYLKLTPDDSPLPKIIADISKDKDHLHHRSVVKDFDTALNFSVEKIPETLKMKSNNKADFCDNIPESYNYCYNREKSKVSNITSSSRCKTMENYTSVFKESYNEGKYMEVRHRYRKASGGWVTHTKGKYKVYPGRWKRLAIPGKMKRYRRAARSGVNESTGLGTEYLYWKGYTDFRNSK